MNRREKLVLLLLLAAAPLFAEDWPTYLHDAARSGVTKERLALPLYEQWVYKAAHAPVPAWPAPAKQDFWHEIRELRPVVTYDRAYHAVIAEGALYFATTSDDQVYCLDAATGEQRWTFYAEAPIRLAPTIAEGKVYFGADDGWVYCLNAKDGALGWKQRPAPEDRRYPGNGRIISSTPIRCGMVVENGTVWFMAGLFPSEGVYCCALDAATGAVRWSTRVEGDIAPQGYLVASPSRLFVPTGRTSPAVFDRNTGKFLQQLGGGGGAYAVLTCDTIVSGPGRRGGTELSLSDPNTNENIAQCDGIAMVVDGPLAYIQSRDEIKVLDRPRFIDLSRIWNQRNTELKGVEKQSEEAQKRLDAAEVKRLKTVMEPIEAAMEELDKQREACYRWKQPSDCPYSLILAGNVLFVGGEGKVAAHSVQDGARVWEAPVPGRVYGLSVAQGRLYVSTSEGTIHGFASSPLTQPVAIAPTVSADQQTEDAWTAAYSQLIDAALTEAGTNKGYCIVLGNGEGRLAHLLAQHSEFKIIDVEKGPEHVQRARQRLNDAGLYGTRVAVQEWQGETLPYTTYMANLVVSEAALRTGVLDMPAKEMARVLHPYGGVAVLGCPKECPGNVSWNKGTLNAWLAGLPEGVVKEEKGIWTILRQAPAPGAGEWTQLYADSGHTACSMDPLQGPMKILWFGEPGPRDIIDRHHRPMSSLFKQGRLFIPGDNLVMAADGYNGTPLWRLDVPDSRRVGALKNCGHMVLTDDLLYIAVKNECWAVRPDTGERVTAFAAPQHGDESCDWGYLDCAGERLIGSGQAAGASFNELSKGMINILEGDHRPMVASQYMFCLDRHSGKRHWIYHKGAIVNDAIAIADDHLFFVESRNERIMKEKDGRIILRQFCANDTFLMSLRLKNGKKAWEQPIALPFEHIMYLNGAQGVLVLTGSYNKKSEVYYGLFAFDMATGKPRWNTEFRAVNANGKEFADTGGSHGEQWQHPVIIGSTVYARPNAYNLITGEKQEFRLFRGGHGCGGLTGSAHYLYGRGSNPRMYPVNESVTEGIRLTEVSRPGCWLNIIPAGGIIMIPESSSGCTCAYPVQTSFGFIPESRLR